MSAPDRRDRVDDYVAGALDDADAERLEEEIFEAAARGDDADVRFADLLSRLATFVAPSGIFDGGWTQGAVDALRASGARVHFSEVAPGGDNRISAWQDAEVDVCVFKVRVDLRGCQDIDVEASRLDGTPIMTFRDVRCDPDSGALYTLCEPRLARMSIGSIPVRWRVVAKASSAGARAVLAEYTTSPAL